MITGFAHKGLRGLFATGSTSGVPAERAAKLLRMLDKLDSASVPADMSVPGWNFHPLTGDRAGTYTVSVSGNWRLTFTMSDGDAQSVNLEDYH